MAGDRTLSWDPTVDGGPRLPGPPLLPPAGIGDKWIGLPSPVRPEIERLGAVGCLAQQRERERVTQDELDCVAQTQIKAEENAWTRRLQTLKSHVVAEKQKAAAEEQLIRILHTHNQGLEAEYDRLRAQRNGEQQLLAADQAQGDRLISNRVTELRGLNDLIFAAGERQIKLDTIEEMLLRQRCHRGVRVSNYHTLSHVWVLSPGQRTPI